MSGLCRTRVEASWLWQILPFSDEELFAAVEPWPEYSVTRIHDDQVFYLSKFFIAIEFQIMRETSLLQWKQTRAKQSSAWVVLTQSSSVANHTSVKCRCLCGQTCCSQFEESQVRNIMRCTPQKGKTNQIYVNTCTRCGTRWCTI